MIDSINNSRVKIEENIYFIAFGINLIISIIGSSTIFSLMNSNEQIIIANLTQYTCMLLLFIKFILHNHYSVHSLIIKSFIFFVGLMTLRYYGLSIFMICLFIICADDINFRKLIKISFWITLFMIGLVIILAELGFIENLIYYRGTQIRESFGFQYVTVFASYIFYLFAMYFYFKTSKLKIVECILVLLVVFMISMRCNARLSTITMILLIVFIWISDYFPNILNHKVIKILIKNSFWIFSLAIIFLSYMFTPSGWLNKLNIVMAGRLALGKETFLIYPIKLFGQKILQYGWGGTIEHDITKNYFYIDSSYLRLLFMYGLIIFIMYGLMFYFLYAKAYKNQDYRLIMILLIITITGMIDENMIKIINVFVIYLFANPTKYKIDKDIK